MDIQQAPFLKFMVSVIASLTVTLSYTTISNAGLEADDVSEKDYKTIQRSAVWLTNPSTWTDYHAHFGIRGTNLIIEKDGSVTLNFEAVALSRHYFRHQDVPDLELLFLKAKDFGNGKRGWVAIDKYRFVANPYVDVCGGTTKFTIYDVMKAGFSDVVFEADAYTMRIPGDALGADCSNLPNWPTLP